ncbi:Stk1 family PASTA domain-containing Ser/Thr kinase [Leucobacter chinensis]|uniref:Stk1 family PASTA domain-containing Ser/Thr kinase n=1 Tax=Leucobacter chinensis TaxID=2851010 RepID=UPI00350F3877
MTEASGRRLLAGRYEVGEFIGQGGMSTVYRGVDTKLGRPVAIKIMKAQLAQDSEFRDRFRQEARAASRMAHPSIVRVFDAGDELINLGTEVQRLPFIVMEYVKGKNLREIVQEKPLSTSEITRVLDAVLTALEYSHRAGIVHRDIKLANIMVTDTGHVKVMDFGIARAVSETSSTLQQTTAILGTAAYFSPEQAKGESVDARTDLYSAGVVLYELLVGDVPFRGDSAVAVAYQHVSERPELPSTRNPAITPEFDRVVMHALAKDRAKRFQNAAEFREALRLAADGKMPELALTTDSGPILFSSGDEISESELALRQLTESSSSPKSQPRPPVMWTWAAILTVVAVVVAVIFWLTQLVPPNTLINSAREIPDLEGTTEKVAMQTLEDLDLVAVPVSEPNDDIAAESVFKTYPAAGEVVEVGTTVKVYVSSGPFMATLPDLSGKSIEDATEKLNDLGLTVGLTNELDDPSIPGGSVISSSPAEGELVLTGSAVDLTVSNGKVTVPDVKGMSMPTAQEMLDPTGVNIEQEGDSSCGQINDLPVINQSVVGQVEQRSTVTLFYCSG